MKFLAFNTLASFGDPERQASAVDVVEDINPDVAFFSEAMNEDDNIVVVNKAVVALRGLGYHVTRGYENDVGNGTARTGFIGIVRESIGSGKKVWGATRQGFQADIDGSVLGRPLSVIGYHFDDLSEGARLNQLSALPSTDVIMGDFNAIEESMPLAHALRAVLPVTNRFSERDNDFRVTTGKIDRTISMAQRFARMGEGRLINNLEARGLHDADPKARPTIHGIAQLDHIMLVSDLEVTDFTVHKSVTLSDHKPISAIIHRQ